MASSRRAKEGAGNVADAAGRGQQLLEPEVECPPWESSSRRSALKRKHEDDESSAHT